MARSALRGRSWSGVQLIPVRWVLTRLGGSVWSRGWDRISYKRFLPGWRRALRLSHIVFAVLIAISAAKLIQAQEHIWIPQGIEALRKGASSKTEFTLDHSMLVFASKLDPDNEDLRRVIAGVSGVSVHRYHFPDAWTYDPLALNSVKEEYHAAGWKQLVNNHEKDGGAGVSDP